MKGDKNRRMDRVRIRTQTATPPARAKTSPAGGGVKAKLGKFGSLAAMVAGGAAMLAKRRSAKSTPVQTIDYTPVQDIGLSTQPAVETTPPVVMDTTTESKPPL